MKPRDLVEYEAARARLDRVTSQVETAVDDDEFGDMVTGMQDRRPPPTKKRKRR